MNYLLRILALFLAPFSWPIRCKYDWHDWRDGDLDIPAHFHVYTCRRCGKEFEI